MALLRTKRAFYCKGSFYVVPPVYPVQLPLPSCRPDTLQRIIPGPAHLDPGTEQYLDLIKSPLPFFFRRQRNGNDTGYGRHPIEPGKLRQQGMAGRAIPQSPVVFLTLEDAAHGSPVIRQAIASVKMTDRGAAVNTPGPPDLRQTGRAPLSMCADAAAASRTPRRV